MSEPPHVLVVDDSQPVRSLLAQALRVRGWRVTDVASGAEALRAAYDRAPAVAIVDQWMPGMTGAELIRLLRQSRDERVRAIRIIGLSGRPGSETELLRAGARVFLRKPFGEAELAAAMTRVMQEGDGIPHFLERRREPA